MVLNSSLSAIVTGGASGLGAAAARALAAAGVRVALFDLNSRLGQALAAELGGIYCCVDVTDNGQVEAGLQRARAALGQERILVNCAGISVAARTASRDRDTGQIRHFPLDRFNAVLQVNLIGTFRCIARCAAGMLTLDPLKPSGERGAIINTASIAAEDGQVGQAAYSASKAGVVGMTLPIARDLMNEGIRVNTILPGVFDTPMVQDMPQVVRDNLAATVPFPKRLGAAADYGALVCHLIENSYFNASSMRLDGALRMGVR